ncbi:hypothetical protein [Nannocystis pusilla]|uniref:hypothetical protein n=1 Tax=Nannocystis pusilla TaxID=889268 RepID=UPI003B7A630E
MPGDPHVAAFTDELVDAADVIVMMMGGEDPRSRPPTAAIARAGGSASEGSTSQTSPVPGSRSK